MTQASPQSRATELSRVTVQLNRKNMLTCTFVHFDDVVQVSLVLWDSGFNVM